MNMSRVAKLEALAKVMGLTQIQIISLPLVMERAAFKTGVSEAFFD